MATDDQFIRYLAAKRRIDDRALNRRVWQSFKSAVEDLPVKKPDVLELGCGIGTMVERMLEWQAFRSDWTYTGIDSHPDVLGVARDRLWEWARVHQHLVAHDGEQGLEVRYARSRLKARFQPWLLQDLIQDTRFAAKWDVIVGHAFLDLIDLPSGLPGILNLLRPERLFYFTLTFDGITALEPGIDPALDSQIEAAYHETMDQRTIDGKPSGDSHSGRHLLSVLQANGAELIDAGSSDWVIVPRHGDYSDDERILLDYIVDTIEGALDRHPSLDTQQFAEWIDVRRAQIKERKLIYIAHQLDVVGRSPAL